MHGDVLEIVKDNKGGGDLTSGTVCIKTTIQDLIWVSIPILIDNEIVTIRIRESTYYPWDIQGYDKEKGEPESTREREEGENLEEEEEETERDSDSEGESGDDYYEDSASFLNEGDPDEDLEDSVESKLGTDGGQEDKEIHTTSAGTVIGDSFEKIEGRAISSNLIATSSTEDKSHTPSAADEVNSHKCNTQIVSNDPAGHQKGNKKQESEVQLTQIERVNLSSEGKSNLIPEAGEVNGYNHSLGVPTQLEDNPNWIAYIDKNGSAGSKQKTHPSGDSTQEENNRVAATPLYKNTDGNLNRMETQDKDFEIKNISARKETGLMEGGVFSSMCLSPHKDDGGGKMEQPNTLVESKQVEQNWNQGGMCQQSSKGCETGAKVDKEGSTSPTADPLDSNLGAGKLEGGADSSTTGPSRKNKEDDALNTASHAQVARPLILLHSQQEKNKQDHHVQVAKGAEIGVFSVQETSISSTAVLPDSISIGNSIQEERALTGVKSSNGHNSRSQEEGTLTGVFSTYGQNSSEIDVNPCRFSVKVAEERVNFEEESSDKKEKEKAAAPVTEKKKRRRRFVDKKFSPIRTRHSLKKTQDEDPRSSKDVDGIPMSLESSIRALKKKDREEKGLKLQYPERVLVPVSGGDVDKESDETRIGKACGFFKSVKNAESKKGLDYWM